MNCEPMFSVLLFYRNEVNLIPDLLVQFPLKCLIENNTKANTHINTHSNEPLKEPRTSVLILAKHPSTGPSVNS